MSSISALSVGGVAQSPVSLRPSVVATLCAVVFSGAIFGFFYAWVCSTLWGLNSLDPRAAITAMNAMNSSVRNPVFFPIFFLTPVVTGVAALLAWKETCREAARWLGAAAVLYAIGGVGLTVVVNVPLNEALMAASVPATVAEASVVWGQYSSRWEFFNGVRTVISGGALVLTCLGLISVSHGRGEL